MAFPDRPRVLITGASSGLGRALALELAERQARILVTDIRMEPAEATVEMVEAKGGEARMFSLDVTSTEHWAAARQAMHDAWGGIDVLANNAGVAAVGPVGEVSLEDWKWLIDINLWGVIHGCHTFVPDMRASGSGFILNVASSAGLLSVPEMAPYNVAKAGVISLTETLQGELRRCGVKVTALCPTFFRSELHERTRTTSETLEELTRGLVGNASWTAEQIAEVALRGLEAGELLVIPQMDGQLMWRLKRTLGTTALHRLMRLTRNAQWHDGALPWSRKPSS